MKAEIQQDCAKCVKDLNADLIFITEDKFATVVGLFFVELSRWKSIFSSSAKVKAHVPSIRGRKDFSVLLVYYIIV